MRIHLKSIALRDLSRENSVTESLQVCILHRHHSTVVVNTAQDGKLSTGVTLREMRLINGLR